METEKNMTVEQYLSYWFETYAKRNIKRSTAVSYRGYIVNHVIPKIGSERLSELNTNILQDFFNGEIDCGNVNDGKGLSPKTLHNIALMLHKALKKAVELELISKNYIEFVELPRMRVPKVNVLDKSERAKLANELKRTDEKLYFGVYLAITLGMRLGEVLGLRWSDVDFETDVLHIKRTVNRLNVVGSILDEATAPLHKTELVVGSPKSDSSVRDIPFNLTVKEAFICYQEKERKRLKIERFRDEDYVLMLRRGFPVEPKTMQDVTKRIEAAAGIRDVNFHSFRHTFATRAIEKGVDVKTLSVLLGHSDVTVTVNISYGHTCRSSRYSIKTNLLSISSVVVKKF